MQVRTGYLPFGQYQTYYRIVGDLTSGVTPLLLLHGGPGSTHNYFESFDQFAERAGRPLVMYDQLGCGQSSMPTDPSVFCAETWVKELQNLRTQLGLTKVHLLGQSWGGMLALIYLCDTHPKGVQSLILASTLSSAALWAQEQHRLINSLLPVDQAAIAQAEASGDFTQPAYLKANDHFMLRHAAGPITGTSPEYLRRPKRAGTLAYQTAWGPNEYGPNGNLKAYDYTDKLAQLTLPTLITSGVDDLCTPLIAKTMVDHLPNATWTLFAHSRHMAFIDESAAYFERLTTWFADRA
ncbi:proline iminopeptidase [Lactobacillus koreensis] [Lactiplantibacillus mudanjiangensis]|uniref:proline iminopeptidase n=1 Tax=Lactiplantibacillus mudanjiangensis TaxID=1296538 RepID=UPI0010158EDA|nr:proline iminopeptidase-family hydrolase [Lactiplantibacillus mudanjiangensis]VDG20966.1 proline iminopeptidase [Lactobacillus koreensis] [Lactiplantibacillus mudanjiangensis]VDG31913.1 proline iminopeptidase [Lactobacillus koreensis] [Lactiplantibacillus mudanjiangensis]